MVSIVIPTHDRAHTLADTLESVIRQTFAPWECLLVDDHSTDGTAGLARRFESRDPRILYLALPEGIQGANAARNWGAARAQGDFILFLDSDDALAPGCLEQRVDALSGRPELDFGVFPTLLFRETPGDAGLLWNVETGEDDLDRFLALDIPWQTAGVLWRRAALAKTGPWREGLPSWQDWEFHLRALMRGLAYRRFGNPDSYWRMPRADSIWNHSKNAANLCARVGLLAGMVAPLRRSGRWNDHRKHLLAGLYFWHARLWYSQLRNRRQACAVWAQAWKLGLIPFGRFVEGLRWFTRFTRGRSDDIKIVFPSWPVEYGIGTSPTFQKTPASV